MAGTKRRVGVIGAGMVGVCAARWLQRDGHSVFLIEPGNPGEGAAFGNAGAFNGASVTPVAMPGVIRQVPGWLKDPLGPLSLRWQYLPTILPYLARMVRSATPEKVRAQARALRPLIAPTVPLVRELARDAGAEVEASDGPATVVARLDPKSKIREGETTEVAVDTSAVGFFDPETGVAIYDSTEGKGAG
jgi:glycine/D-amino acid oxidase-like deaminating enzyme